MKIRTLYKILLQKIKPLKYAKKVGVNFPNGGLHIYGSVN